MPKSFEYDDDGFPAIDWRVVVREYTVTFHANVDDFDEVFDPNAGEFALTLTRDDIENMLRHNDKETR